MSELTKAVLKCGMLDESQLREFSRWRSPIDLPTDLEVFDSSEEAAASIEDALSSANQVEVRPTDLNVVKQYERTKRKGRLHLVLGEESGSCDVVLGVTATGEYLVPWRSDSICDVLTNGESYLMDGRRKVYLSNAQDLYFGNEKVFILCTPIKETNGKRIGNATDQS